VIIVQGNIPLRSESRDKAIELARKMVAATKSEEGCISYDFYLGLSDPDTLMVFQEWETMEALMEHLQTPHMEDFLRELPDVVSGEITTKRFAVHKMEDEESIESAPLPEPIVH
tara:strand:- start:50 stop:391 length:342 start_codon:yes stop_codon:yes gene_type:complete